MYYIEKSKLNELFKKISETKALYLPVKKNGQTNFAKWEEGTEYCDDLKTVKSAKDHFFPQTESLMHFKTEGKKISINQDKIPDEKTVLFGVRGCDAKSFTILDKVFMAEPKDAFYTARRENAVIITTACSKPDETCFCSVFGVNPAEPKADSDVVTYFAGDKLYWESVSEKGQALFDEVKELMSEDDGKEAQDEKENISKIVKMLPLNNMSLSSFGGDKTEALFNAPEWDKLSEACLGCGSCTFVCPTCQCYDVRDYNGANGVQRYRCWDSCMFNDFTMMAHGTPRPTQKQRFRQRFMHKLVYFPANNNGEFSCVGCGRCVSRCPISMNIAKVIKTFGGDK